MDQEPSKSHQGSKKDAGLSSALKQTVLSDTGPKIDEKAECYEIKSWFTSSYIIKSYEQKVNLYKFFDGKKIKDFGFYDGGRDGDGDLYGYYYGLRGYYGRGWCKEPHKLLIIQTKTNHKFGIYTPLKWEWKQGKTIIKEESTESFKSFIFSLSNNQKFISEKKWNSIINFYEYEKKWELKFCGEEEGLPDLIWGVNFGKKDIYGEVNLNRNYINKNYNQSNEASLERFCGNSKGILEIKTVQLWIVNFQK